MSTQPQAPGGPPRRSLAGLFAPRREVPESRKLDLKEMKIAYLAVLFQIGASIAAWAPQIGHIKGAQGALVAGLLAAVLLFLSVRSRSRIGTAVASFLCAFVASRYIYVALPFLALAGWLTMKNSRVVAAERAKERAKNPPPPRRTRKQRKADKDAGAEAARRPQPSKRYTPPRPDEPTKGRRR